MQLLGRVGLIGDVHAEDEALAFAIETLEALGAETLLQVGDIADGPGDLARTVTLLREHRVLAVRGNHDRWLLADQLRELPYARSRAATAPDVLDYLASLPVTREFRSALGQVLLCHGLGDSDMACVKPEHHGEQLTANPELGALIEHGRYRFVLNGHTHEPMLRRVGTLSIVNAGTLLRTDDRCFSLLDFDRAELSRYRHAGTRATCELAAWTLEHERLDQGRRLSFD